MERRSATNPPDPLALSKEGMGIRERTGETTEYILSQGLRLLRKLESPECVSLKPEGAGKGSGSPRAGLDWRFRDGGRKHQLTPTPTASTHRRAA
jgi:hypothetical protein